MPYLIQEDSRAAGQPIELYDFVLSGTKYSLCTCSNPVTYGGTTYTPLEINRNEIVVGPEDLSTLVEVTMPSSHALPRQFITSVPGVLCSVTITRVHKTDSSNELYITYKGILRSVSFSDKGGVAKVGLMSQAAAMSRNVPRYTFQSLCNHVLFDRWCTISRAAFDFSGTVSLVAGLNITVPGLSANGDHWAQGGYAQVGTDYRLILDQVGNVCTLLLPFNTDVTSLAVDILAGCDRSLATCRSKFNNVANFGGYAFIPKDNPFETGIS